MKIKIGDIHWSWTGTEWIPCTVYKISKTGKSFMCYNEERDYGSYAYKPNREFVAEPV